MSAAVLPNRNGLQDTQNNLKYSSSTFKKYKNTGKINFNMLNLTCYIQNISTCDQYKNYWVILYFFLAKSEIQCVFYTYNTSQFILATFQLLSLFIWYIVLWISIVLEQMGLNELINVWNNLNLVCISCRDLAPFSCTASHSVLL